MAAKTLPTALVTGANQGIGLATATSLATKHNYHVIIGSRKLAAAEKIVSDLTAAGHSASSLELDLDSEASINKAITTLTQQFDHLDVLVNNAGILHDGTSAADGRSSFDILRQTLLTNVVGPAALTEGLIPLLKKAPTPARIVFVSSMMGSLTVSTDPSTMFYATDYKYYDASKAAVNMLMLNYHRNLKDAGVKVNAVCPGLNKTSMTAYTDYGHSPEVGAVHVVEMATISADGPSGTFSNAAGTIPW